MCGQQQQQQHKEWPIDARIFFSSFRLCSSLRFLILWALRRRRRFAILLFAVVCSSGTTSSFWNFRLHFCFAQHLPHLLAHTGGFTHIKCTTTNISIQNRIEWIDGICLYMRVYGSRCHHLSILYMDDVCNVVVIAGITGPHKRVNTCTCQKVNRFELYTFTNIFGSRSLTHSEPASQPKTKNQNKKFSATTNIPSHTID